MSRTRLPRAIRPAMAETVRQYAIKAGDEYLVSAREILSPCRRALVVHARNSVMRRLRDDGYSTPQIGELLDRDHSTVLHGLGRLNK